jgi:exodeoxyribonuclease V gamma subunit
MIESCHKNGDRSLPVQDRYLLLEAVMSARKNLLLFYQGRSSRTNKDKPACAPLSEIMHYLENAFELKEYKHKLTGIDPAYFVEDAPYRSFDMENFLTVSNMFKDSIRAIPAGSKPELYDAPQWQEHVTIDEMVNFFSNPCGWIMRNQMGVVFSRENLDSGDEEPWLLERYKNWQIDSMLVEMELREQHDAYAHAARSNLLPPGRFGEYSLEERRQVTATLPERWKEWLQNSSRMPVCTELQLKESICKVRGMVNVSNDMKQILVYRFSSYKAFSALSALFGALVSTIAWRTPVGAQILNLSKEGFEQRCIDPFEVAEAEELLSYIITLALQKRFDVIPLFPQASVYYQDMDIAEQKFYKLQNYEETGDVTDKSISYFYSSLDWDEIIYDSAFEWWAKLLYSHIKTVNGGGE